MKFLSYDPHTLPIPFYLGWLFINQLDSELPISGNKISLQMIAAGIYCQKTICLQKNTAGLESRNKHLEAIPSFY